MSCHRTAGVAVRRASRRATVLRRAVVLAGVLVTGALPSTSHGASRVLGPQDIGVAGAAASDTNGVRVVFLLKRQRDDLGTLALAVSDPASAQYGHYSTVAQIAARYGASAAVIGRVAAFLAGFGATSEVDVTGSFSSALLDDAQVEAIFGAHPATSPPVPAELAGAVTYIVGAFRSSSALTVPRVGPLRGAAGDGIEVWPSWAMGSGTPAPCPGTEAKDCSDVFANPGPPASFRSFTPNQLRSAYGLDRTGLTGKGRSAAVVEFGQAVLPSDLAAYSAGLGLPPVDLVQILADATSAPIDPGSEATLDVETIAGMAPGIERLTLLTAYAKTDAEYVTYWPIVFAMALDVKNTGGRLIDVLSSSWGFGCERSLGESNAIVGVTESILQTAAAAGVTVATAAGDQGSSGCTSRRPPYADRALALEYPGSSPWVTSVGATHLTLAPDNQIAEIGVWNDWPLQLDRALPGVECSTPPCRPAPVWSGAGGKSILFDRPSWQQGFGVDPENARQAPDVAFLGDIYPATLLHFQGVWSGQGNGTSQATPIFASITLAYNEFAAQARRPRLGFAAPLLYSLAALDPTSFIDVVEGDNIIGDNEHQFSVDCCFAAPGYDLASGWGSLLLDHALATLSPGLLPIVPANRLPVLPHRAAP